MRHCHLRLKSTVAFICDIDNGYQRACFSVINFGKRFVSLVIDTDITEEHLDLVKSECLGNFSVA